MQKYLSDFFNLADLCLIGLSMSFVCDTLFDLNHIPISWLRVIGILASFFLVVKIFDWLRLFDKTTFYILLIEETIQDVIPFLTIFTVSLLMSSIPMSIIQQIQNQEEDKEISVKFDTGSWFIDALINQYLIALGDFALVANLESNPLLALTLPFFLFTTLFTHLTMLNMIIAVMGDTFGRTTDNRIVNGIKTKI